MFAFLSKAKNIFLDILFPPLCLSCRKFLSSDEKEKNICAVCFNSIIIHSSLFCPTCRARLPENRPICHFDEKFILGAAADFHLPPVRHLIHTLKFGKIPFASKIIASLLISYFESLHLETENFVVLPLPLSKIRLKERGFNQSELIAKNFCSAFNLPLIKNLIRRKNTLPQSETKNRREREENIKNCFSVTNDYELKNKNIIVIDDVFTTGSTAREAVRVLKNSGARKIILLTFAKT